MLPDAPAAPLFEEALIFLGALFHSIDVDCANGRWIFTLNGKATTEGEIVAKAIALGMMGHETVQ